METDAEKKWRWIETRLVKPPTFTVTGRFGASVMFVGYERWTKSWVWLQPGGVTERISEPPHLFLEEDYIANNLLPAPRARTEKPSRIHRAKRGEQLSFDL
jgi:hypothetical protein